MTQIAKASFAREDTSLSSPLEWLTRAMGESVQQLASATHAMRAASVVRSSPVS
jgi:hypothetical protein